MQENHKPAPKPEKKNQSQISEKTQKTKNQNIVVACCLGVLVLAATVFFVVQGAIGPKAASSVSELLLQQSGSLRPTNSSSIVQSSSVLPQYQSAAILPESKDAGEEYVASTLFLGDSNTARIQKYSGVDGISQQNCIGVINMGAQQVQGLNCVQFSGYNSMVTMPKAVELLEAQRIIITFGTNNLGNKVETFIQFYKNALDALEKANPNAEIILGAIPPVAEKHTYGKHVTKKGIDEYNEALVKLAEERDYNFLNWAEVLKDPKTGYSKPQFMAKDGVHLEKAGMEEMIKYFRTHAITSSDKVLNPIVKKPIRLPTPDDLLAPPAAPTPESESISSSSSSFAREEVTVVVQTIDVNANVQGGGTLNFNGQIGTVASWVASAGQTSPQIVVTANEGYEFLGWSATKGTINSSYTVFVVPDDVVAGETIVLTAQFRAVEVSSSSVPEQPTQSEVPAPETPVPEAPVPEAPVPEAPVPEAPVPEAPVPEAPVPEAPAPEAPAPEVPVQEIPVSEEPIVPEETPQETP